MMRDVLGVLIFGASSLPLAAAWRASCGTTLIHAVGWTSSAWIVWGMTLWLDLHAADAATVRYLALSLTGCAGVAVLGARRPGVVAWHFVVAGLLAVMLLPIAESKIAGGELHLAGPRLLFLGATLAVVLFNYLPTRAWLAILILAFVLTVQMQMISTATPLREHGVLYDLFLTIPLWLVWLSLRGARGRAECDRLWLGFRDRYGLFWGQRTREQFNRAAEHAGWNVVMRWHGLRITPGAAKPNAQQQDEIVALLNAILQRFRNTPANEIGERQ